MLRWNKMAPRSWLSQFLHVSQSNSASYGWWAYLLFLLISSLGKAQIQTRTYALKSRYLTSHRGRQLQSNQPAWVEGWRHGLCWFLASALSAQFSRLLFSNQERIRVSFLFLHDSFLILFLLHGALGILAFVFTFPVQYIERLLVPCLPVSQF